MKTEFIPFGRLAELRNKPGAHLLLVKPGRDLFSEWKVIRFPTRHALEEFNKKAGLKPMVFTTVPKGCAIYAHQQEARP